jgi:hypothetical protein
MDNIFIKPVKSGIKTAEEILKKELTDLMYSDGETYESKSVNTIKERFNSPNGFYNGNPDLTKDMTNGY